MHPRSDSDRRLRPETAPRRDSIADPARLKGPWSADDIRRFLDDFHEPLRLACLGGSGHPVLATLWFVPREGRLWCATQRSADVVSHLERDPRCAFEASVAAPPYRGVRGQGIARCHDEGGAEILRTLIDRYLGDARSELAQNLLHRADQEVAISIEPESVVTWDFSERMADVS